MDLVAVAEGAPKGLRRRAALFADESGAGGWSPVVSGAWSAAEVQGSVFCDLVWVCGPCAASRGGSSAANVLCTGLVIVFDTLQYSLLVAPCSSLKNCSSICWGRLV